MTTMAEQVEDEQQQYDEGQTEDEQQQYDEQQTEDEEQAEDEPEQLASIGPEEIRKAERASEAQRRKLAGILGDAYVAHECIFCAALGFTPELPPVGAVFTILETEDGRAYEVQPPAPDIPLLAAPDKAMCDECDGYGEVLSGSKAPHGMVTPCSKCSGNGWVMVARDVPVGLPASLPVTATSQPWQAEIAGGMPDAWGRPAGHRHWGQHPATIEG